MAVWLSGSYHPRLVAAVAIWGTATALIGLVPRGAAAAPCLVALRAAVAVAMVGIYPLLQVVVARHTVAA